MNRRDIVSYSAAGLAIWLNGAVTFRLGGRVLFEHGPLVVAVVGIVVAILVCLAFHATMAWRRGNRADAVTIAVIMALPGLFGEAARQMVFSWAVDMPVADAPAFAAVIFFGNGVLMAYALWLSPRAK